MEHHEEEEEEEGEEQEGAEEEGEKEVEEEGELAALHLHTRPRIHQEPGEEGGSVLELRGCNKHTQVIINPR